MLRASLLIGLAITACREPLASSTTASGESGVTAEVLQARWVEAVGGRDRLRAIRSTYSRARVEGSEGTGRVEEWSTSRLQRRQLSEITSGEELTVFDGQRGWFRVNGQVRPLSPDENRGELSAAYLAGVAHLVPGRSPGRFEYLGQNGPGGPHVVRVTPRGGRATRFHLDPRTYLPLRSERDLVSTTLTIEYHDWREVDGVRVPWRLVLTTADSGYVSTETLEEIRFNLRLEPGLFGRPVDGPSDVHFDAPDQVARIPIEIRDAHIFFRGTLDDSLVWLTLDTGASTHVVDDAFARATGMTLIGSQRLFGAAGSTDAARGRGLVIGLPGVRVASQWFTTTPLRFLEGPSGLHVKAILGYDIFSRFVVEVDYAGREMRLHDPARYRYRGRGASIPITLRENHPYVRAQIKMPGGLLVDGEFVIDTGSGNTLMLAADFSARHDLPQRLDRKQETRGQAVGGELRTVVGRLPGMRLGPFQVDGPIVLFPNGQITAPGFAGNIGGRLLSRFRAIFDYRRMRMILEPNARVFEREESDMAGLAIHASGSDLDTVRVVRVRPGSPGAEAGVEPGDTLERIDGRSAREIGLDSLRAMFRMERSYELVLRRDDRSVPLTIRTRRNL